jgi:LytS/YehU family sensor histidine kinase
MLKRLLPHIAFWAFIYAFVFDYYYGQVAVPRAVANSAIELVLYMSIAYINLFVLIPRGKGSPWRYVGLVAFFLLLSYGVYAVLGLEERLLRAETLHSKLTYTINFTLFIVISYLYYFVFAFQREKQHTLALRAEMLEKEVHLLKAQISPHFLFNSLNNIYALCLAKSDSAPVMVAKLSDILRYLIQEGGKDRVPLLDEAHMIEEFLALQTLRKVKGAANIRFERSGLMEHHRIVPLLLINFVENAIKHSDLLHNASGYLHIHMRVDDNAYLTFTLANSTEQATGPDGVGMANVKRLLELNYGDRHRFQVDAKPGVYTVELALHV